jgi:hypothetical protein
MPTFPFKGPPKSTQIKIFGLKLNNLATLIKTTGQRKESLDQGDQIGRIFAYWTIVFFGQFLENCKSSPQIFATFSTIKSN